MASGSAYEVVFKIRAVVAGVIQKLRSVQEATNKTSGTFNKFKQVIAPLGPKVSGPLERMGQVVLDTRDKVRLLKRAAEGTNRSFLQMAMGARVAGMAMQRGTSGQMDFTKRDSKGHFMPTTYSGMETMMNKRLAQSSRITRAGFNAISQAGTRMQGVLSEVGGGVRMLSGAMGQGSRANMRFKMHMLSVLFFGMAIQQMFMGTIKNVLQMTGVLDMLGATMTMFLLPVIVPLLPLIFEILEYLINLPEPIRKLIGVAMVLVTAFGAFIMIFGMVSLGISGVMMWISEIIGGLPVLILLGVPLLALLTAVGLGVLMNRDKLGELFGKLMEAVQVVLPLFMNAIDTLGEILKAVFAGDLDKAGELLDVFVDQVLVALLAVVKEVMPIVLDIVTVLLDGFWESLPLIIAELKEIAGKVIAWFISDILPWLNEVLVPRISEWIIQAMRGYDKIARDELTKFMGTILRLLPQLDDIMINVLADILISIDEFIWGGKSRLRGLFKFIKDMGNQISGVLGGGLGGMLGEGATFLGNVIHAKEGGIVPGSPNSAHPAILHGGETVIPAGGMASMGTYAPTYNVTAHLSERVDVENMMEEIRRVDLDSLKRHLIQ